MKKLSIIILVLISTTWMSCEKESLGEMYGGGTSLPPYVALSSTASKTVKEGASTTFTFNIKTALQQAVTITYNVTGGFTSGDKTVIIDRNKTSVVATVAVPTGTIVAPETKATAVLKVTKAVAADGTALTLGATNVAATQVVTINITQ